MMRPILLVLLLCLGLPAAASDSGRALGVNPFADVWVRQLILDGYDDIEVERTWLGRVRIVAEKDDIEREIILNRKSGEVLRDFSRNEDGDFRLPLGFDVELDHDD